MVSMREVGTIPGIFFVFRTKIKDAREKISLAASGCSQA